MENSHFRLLVDKSITCRFIVMFLSTVWTLILTASIQCRGSTAGQLMYCWNLFSWRTSWGWVHLNFCVNCSFNISLLDLFNIVFIIIHSCYFLIYGLAYLNILFQYTCSPVESCLKWGYCYASESNRNVAFMEGLNSGNCLINVTDWTIVTLK